MHVLIFLVAFLPVVIIMAKAMNHPLVAGTFAASLAPLVFASVAGYTALAAYDAYQGDPHSVEISECKARGGTPHGDEDDFVCLAPSAILKKNS